MPSMYFEIIALTAYVWPDAVAIAGAFSVTVLVVVVMLVMYDPVLTYVVFTSSSPI